jgi:hypothetical protein
VIHDKYRCKRFDIFLNIWGGIKMPKKKAAAKTAKKKASSSGCCCC